MGPGKARNGAGRSLELSSAARDNRVVHALDGIRQAQEGDKANAPGTYAGIRRSHELDCYAAMGFPGQAHNSKMIHPKSK